jgi:hypothetical protein
MNKQLIIFLPVLFAICISCEKEQVKPIDIFAEESLTDPVNLNLGNDSGLDKLMVNADRIIETPGGYHVKGTVFSQSVSGIIPVTSGDFTIKTASPPASLSKGIAGLDFNGYGTADFPSSGLFSVTEVDEIPGSEVYYNTGRTFKAQSVIDLLPLLDDRYYFRYKLDKAGKGKEYKMKKITIKLKEFYLDARDPATLFAGDVYTEKAGSKKLLIEQGVLGISANELWEFIPYVYSSNLETVTGGTGFERMNGGISISGIIPIKKYPLKILGQGVINTSYSSNGTFDFFERGFEDASFRLGVNGKLFFSNDLVTFLTNIDTVKLGKATLQAEFSDDDFSIRMAGEYSDDILERFLGKTMMSFIPYNAREGVMYLRGTKNPDDLLIYVEEKISLQIPGLGVTPLANSVFRITKDAVGLSGTVTLPYNIGDVKVSGVLGYDGTFLLTGLTNCDLDLGAGLIYNADLMVEVSDKGVALSGSMAFPYGIGDVEVTGALSTDELYFRGVIASSIPFPVNASVNSDLQVSISTKTGISLGGSLSLPGSIGKVEVTGAVNSEELLLKGTIGSGISINFGNVDIRTNTAFSLTASSRSGIVMTGLASLPLSLGQATATVRVTAGGLSMAGDLGSHIKISGYPLFNADMSVSASTEQGMRVYGNMQFPGNFGWVYISGTVRNTGYNMSGDIGSKNINFGIGTLSAGFSVGITNYSGIDISGSAKGCIDLLVDEVCATVGVDIEIDYTRNSVRLCVDFPVVGEGCTGW